MSSPEDMGPMEVLAAEGTPALQVIPTAPPTASRFAITLGNAGLGQLTDYSFYDTVFDGTHPHGWGTQGPVDFLEEPPRIEDAARFLPDGVQVERSVTLEAAVEVMARGEGCVIQLFLSLGWYVVRVAATSPSSAQDLGRALVDRFPRPVEAEADPAVVPIRSWSVVHGQMRDRLEEVRAPAWEEVAGLYTETTRTQLEELMAVEPVEGRLRPGRIVLLTGPPGVGKSSAIRTLARAWRSWCVFESLQFPERVFADPELLREVTSHPAPADADRSDKRTHRALVFDDADHNLGVGARSGSDPAIGRLLGLADGWTGSSNLLIVICSNTPSSRMHPAIVRPGRCLADVSFGLLKPSEASEIIAGAARMPKVDISLADAFELRTGSAVSKADAPSGMTGYL